MVRQMISLDPGTRPTFDTLLHTSRGTVFPESFYSFLHNYVSTINELPNPPPFSLPSPQTLATVPPTPHAVGSTRSTSTIGTTAHPPAESSSSNSGESLPSDSDHRMERIWADYESVEPYLVPDIDGEMEDTVKIDPGKGEYGTSTPFQDVLPVELHIPNRDSKLRGAGSMGRRAATEGDVLLFSDMVFCIYW
jgi:phosphoinositide-3-kinase, regulatory subunit 4